MAADEMAAARAAGGGEVNLADRYVGAGHRVAALHAHRQINKDERHAYFVNDQGRGGGGGGE